MPVTAKNSRMVKLTIERYVCSQRDQWAVLRFQSGTCRGAAAVLLSAKLVVVK